MAISGVEQTNYVGKKMREFLVENLGSSLYVEDLKSIKKDCFEGKIHFYLINEDMGSLGKIHYNIKTGKLEHTPARKEILNKINEILRKEGML